MRAIYEYTAQFDEELSFPEGAMIELIRTDDNGVDDGWWEGRYKGKVGVFPSVVVELLSDGAVSQFSLVFILMNLFLHFLSLLSPSLVLNLFPPSSFISSLSHFSFISSPPITKSSLSSQSCRKLHPILTTSRQYTFLHPLASLRLQFLPRTSMPEPWVTRRSHSTTPITMVAVGRTRAVH